MKLSVLIPVYNEASTLAELIDLVEKAPLTIEKELIIVDDGSTDGSRDILLKKEKEYNNITLIFHKKNKGKGGAIRTAIKNSTGDILIVQDADLEYNPAEYESLIKPILKGKTKVVYGSRELKKNNKEKSSLAFYLGGRLVTFFTNVLFFSKLTDEPTCYKTFHKDIFKRISFKGNGFEWEPEITAKILKKGWKIQEVPISYYPRKLNQGKKIKARDGIKAILTLIKYRFVD